MKTSIKSSSKFPGGDPVIHLSHFGIQNRPDGKQTNSRVQDIVDEKISEIYTPVPMLTTPLSLICGTQKYEKGNNNVFGINRTVKKIQQVLLDGEVDYLTKEDFEQIHTILEHGFGNGGYYGKH